MSEENAPIEEVFELSDDVKPYFSEEPLPAALTEEDRYEAIELIVKAPIEGDSWFDRIFDFIAADCQGGDEGDCTCGMEHMGGMTGSYDQAFAHSTNLGEGLQPIDLARAIVALTDHSFNSLGNHEEQIAAEGVIKAINWAHKEIKFEEYFENREWENEEDDE